MEAIPGLDQHVRHSCKAGTRSRLGWREFRVARARVAPRKPRYVPGIGTFYLREPSATIPRGVRRIALVVLFVALAATAFAQASTRSWSGRWQRAAGEYGAGSGVFTLVEKGTHVTGVYHWKGCTNVFGRTVVGTAHGNTLIARFNHHGDAGGTLRLRLSSDGHHITGTFKVTSGTCAGASGAFDARYLGKLK